MQMFLEKKRLLASLGVLGLVLALVVGCAPEATPTPVPAAPTKAPAATATPGPKYGGTR